MLRRATCQPALDQDGVLTAAQAERHFGRSHVRAQITSQRWQRPTRGVVVLHNATLTTSQREWVALLATPNGSALAGVTALRRDGLTGFRSDKPIVALPNGATRPTYPDIVPHWSTMLDERDVHPLRAPRRTRAPRSLVDEASWSVNVR